MTKSKVVTLAQIKKAGACPNGMENFESLFGSKVAVTEKLAVTVCSEISVTFLGVLMGPRSKLLGRVHSKHAKIYDAAVAGLDKFSIQRVAELKAAHAAGTYTLDNLIARMQDHGSYMQARRTDINNDHRKGIARDVAKAFIKSKAKAK